MSCKVPNKWLNYCQSLEMSFWLFWSVFSGGSSNSQSPSKCLSKEQDLYPDSFFTTRVAADSLSLPQFSALPLTFSGPRVFIPREDEAFFSGWSYSEQLCIPGSELFFRATVRLVQTNKTCSESAFSSLRDDQKKMTEQVSGYLTSAAAQNVQR